MTRQLARLSLFLAILSTLALAVPAQRGGQGETPDVSEKLEMSKREKRRKMQQEQMLANMTPEERLEHGARRGSRNHCRFVATCRPPKLMPGQTGTLMISAILQGNAVLPAPANVTMIRMPKDTGVSTGDLFVRPANTGKLAKAYQGRPVYENTAIMELPVTMANTATLGDKQQVAVDLKFDIYDGNSGQPIGRFIERISTNIEVGHYHEPAVAGRAAPKAPDVEENVEQPEPAKDQAAGGNDAGASSGGGPDGMGGRVAVPAAPDSGEEESAAPAEADDNPLPMSTGEDGMPTFLLVGGGVILALIVLMLIRRK